MIYRHPLYPTWISIKQRCLNVRCKVYKNYGARGITICSRWLRFENFVEDVSPKPKGFTLDRIDNNKGYSKENCRWATGSQQCRNSRTNRMLTFNGETLPMVVWAE